MIVAPGSTLIHADKALSSARPSRQRRPGNFDFYSPYVLVDGKLNAELAGLSADDVKLEIRTLKAKAEDESAPDVWSQWQTLHSGPGHTTVELGKPRFNGTDVSIHGVYRLQLRVSVSPAPAARNPAGLNSLRLELYFEMASCRSRKSSPAPTPLNSNCATRRNCAPPWS